MTNPKDKADGPPAVTEMEGAALAWIDESAPCTAYEVKRAFETSPSDSWSGSAGAVYPMIKRLEARGLIHAGNQADSRGRRELNLSTAGAAALRVWLFDLDRALAPGFDPLRTRLYFLSRQENADARAFAAAARAGLTAQLSNPPAPPGAGNSRARTLYSGWIKARLAWLEGLD